MRSPITVTSRMNRVVVTTGVTANHVTLTITFSMNHWLQVPFPLIKKKKKAVVKPPLNKPSLDASELKN